MADSPDVELNAKQARDFAGVAVYSLIVLSAVILDQPTIDRKRFRASIQKYLEQAKQISPLAVPVLLDILDDLDRREAH